jgi:hypothetical protein
VVVLQLQDVPIQQLVTTIQLHHATMAHVITQAALDVLIRQHATTTLLQHLMMAHVSLHLALDVLIQQHVTTIQLQPSITVHVCNSMSVVTVVVLQPLDVPTLQLVTTMLRLHVMIALVLTQIYILTVKAIV